MRRLVLLVWLVATPAAVAQPALPLPQPPAGLNTINLSPSQFGPDPVSGDSVRVTHLTLVRSRPNEQAYPCCELKEGDRVQLLEPPSANSPFATITAPEKCLSLIPAQAIEPRTLGIRRKIKEFHKEYPVQVKPGVKTLIHGDLPSGGEYVESQTEIPRGAQVTVVDVHAVTRNGKREDYYLIKTHGKEKRYVLAAHLEGVHPVTKPAFLPNQVASAPSAGPTQAGFTAPQPPGPLNQNNNLPAAVPLAQETLPTPVEAQVRAAEQAYQGGLRYHAWEDAKLRYVQLLDSDIPSVRILAINRLTFIRQHQANPQVVSSRFPQEEKKQTAQAPPPPVNSDIWIPGSQAPAVATARSNPPKPLKEQTIRSTPEPGLPPAAPAAQNPPAPATNIPVYQPPANPAPQNPQPQAAAPRNPPNGQLASTANVPKRKAAGRLFRAVQSDGLNPLYYLANSQGGTTYYVRAWTNSGIDLARYVGKVVEVEGQLVDRRRDELGTYQINVERIQER